MGSQERGKALHGQTGHLSSVYANQSLCLGLQPLPGRELLRCASIPIWVTSVCKLRLWGCWYIPNLELGRSQGMSPDLRFGRHSGITSSRHSLGPLARRSPSTVCVLTQLHAGSSLAWRFDHLAPQQVSSDFRSNIAPCNLLGSWATGSISQSKGACASFPWAAPHSSKPAVASHTHLFFQVVVMIISISVCVTVCLFPSAKFPQLRYLQSNACTQKYRLKCCDKSSWKLRAQLFHLCCFQPTKFFRVLNVFLER